MRSLTTTEIADALDACGIEGALLRIQSLTGLQCFGEAYTVKYAPYESKPDDFMPAADYIDEVPPGSILVIDNQGIDDCTVWGNILTEMALIKGLAGTVVHGMVRDIAKINALKYPLFACGVYMRSGKNRVYKVKAQCTLDINGVMINPGDMILGDENGVVCIPKHLLQEVLDKAEAIRWLEEQIITSLKEGNSLAKARKAFGYHKPWTKRLNDANHE
jgi:regulator of RNase E activity RraA